MNTEESTCRAISQELRINLSSQCPYLVSCYQSFYHNGLVSIILEFMDGGSLADLLKKVEKVPENMLAAICKRVLYAKSLKISICFCLFSLKKTHNKALSSLLNAGPSRPLLYSSREANHSSGLKAFEPSNQS